MCRTYNLEESEKKPSDHTKDIPPKRAQSDPNEITRTKDHFADLLTKFSDYVVHYV